MKTFVFIILMVMPNGQPNLQSHMVEACPDPKKIEILFNEMMKLREIIDWGGTCIEFKTVGSS